MINLYKKKPVIVEALQFDGKNLHEAETFVGKELKAKVHSNDLYEVVIETLEGDMIASPGDYIIKGVKEEFYPCKPDIFEATYDITA